MDAHQLQHALRHAHRAGADVRQPDARDAVHDQLEAATDLAEHGIGRDGALVERQLRVAIAPVAHHRLHPRDLEARRALVDQEQRDAAARALLAVGQGHHDDVVGDVAVADEVLAAVEDPAVALQSGGGRDRRRVGARAGLGDGHGADLVAAHRGPQVALGLVGVAGQQHRIDLAEDAADQGVGGLAELLLDQAHGDVVEPAAAAGLGHVHGEQAELLRLAAHARQGLGRHVAEPLGLVLERLHLLGDEAAHGVDEQLHVGGDGEIEHGGEGGQREGAAAGAGASPTVRSASRASMAGVS